LPADRPKIEDLLVNELAFHREEMKKIHQILARVNDQASVGPEAHGLPATPVLENQDIEDLLHQQLAFHREQKRKIDIAMTAIIGGAPKYEYQAGANLAYEPEPRQPIQWSRAINRLFEEYEQLTTHQIRSLLAEQGLPAQQEKYRPTLLNTLSRKVGRSLIRVSPGVYRRIGRSKVVRLDQNNKDSSTTS
jgi:hypothetical protein